MNAFLLAITISLAITSIGAARDEGYTPSPELSQIFSEQWADFQRTLERSRAIQAEQDRQRELSRSLRQLRQESLPLPSPEEIAPRFMAPASPAPTMPPILRTPSGHLYHQYGNIIQGPHGELYTVY